MAHRAPDRGRRHREAASANLVPHDSVAKPIDDGVTADGRPYLVMELLSGETLEERRVRAGGTLPLADVLRHALA